MSSVSSDEDKVSSQPRQRPGLACEECRRRKLRCDRGKPKCEACTESNLTCFTTMSRPPRGPKKGHLKALQARIAALETSLVERQGPASPGGTLCNKSLENSFPETPNFTDQRQWSSCASLTTLNQKSREPTWINSPRSTGSPIAVELSEMVCADLDHLFFDRVHIFAPMIHQKRYFSWARGTSTTESGHCLQRAMWTLAASLSTQYQELSETLYLQTRDMLEALELEESKLENIDVKQPQAWLLLAIYEMMRTTARRGWMSAGRAFRLVQVMRLYELDSPEFGSRQSRAMSQTDWIETEEKRRTFWMAYCVDRFVSIPKGWPLTLNEQVILTRLPAPELQFQSGQVVTMELLSERISGNCPQKVPCSFTECVILATICGRCLIHQQQSLVEQVYGNDASQDFWERQQWLSTILSKQIRNLNLMYPSASTLVDPMLSFAKLAGQTTVLFLYQIMKCTGSEHQQFVAEHEKQSLYAAREVVNLIEPLAPFSYFKVHPFTPICMYLCVRFFLLHPDGETSLNTQYQLVLDALVKLQTVNNLAQTCLALLGHEESANDSMIMV